VNVFLPFSERAKRWEPHGLALRRLGRASAREPLDPWKLAPIIGLLVVDGQAAIELLPSEMRNNLCNEGSDLWSGGVYPVPLPDGKCICILNPYHSRRRSKITLMEEIAHTYLKHLPSKVMLQSDGFRFRDYDKMREQEAYGVGAAALLPWTSFFSAVKAGQDIHEMADRYDVTTQLIEYRIKITGAYRLYKSRRQ
jgi:hypothetical protein